MTTFNTIKDITINESQIVVFIKYHKEVDFKVEEIDKIFIQVHKLNIKAYYALFFIIVPLILFFISILLFRISFIITMCILANTIANGFNSKAYSLIVLFKKESQLKFTFPTDSKNIILEKVRIIRNKINK